jgi:hypothetical protein
VRESGGGGARGRVGGDCMREASFPTNLEEWACVGLKTSNVVHITKQTN